MSRYCMFSYIQDFLSSEGNVDIVKSWPWSCDCRCTAWIWCHVNNRDSFHCSQYKLYFNSFELVVITGIVLLLQSWPDWQYSRSSIFQRILMKIRLKKEVTMISADYVENGFCSHCPPSFQVHFSIRCAWQIPHWKCWVILSIQWMQHKLLCQNILCTWYCSQSLQQSAWAPEWPWSLARVAGSLWGHQQPASCEECLEGAGLLAKSFRPHCSELQVDKVDVSPNYFKVLCLQHFIYNYIIYISHLIRGFIVVNAVFRRHISM